MPIPQNPEPVAGVACPGDLIPKDSSAVAEAVQPGLNLLPKRIWPDAEQDVKGQQHKSYQQKSFDRRFDQSKNPADDQKDDGNRCYDNQEFHHSCWLNSLRQR
jgi:hypothetical protein